MNRRTFAILTALGIVGGLVILSLTKQSERLGFANGYAAGLVAARSDCEVTQYAVDAAVRVTLAECSEQVVALADEVVERLRVIERRHEINPHLLDSLRVDP